VATPVSLGAGLIERYPGQLVIKNHRRPVAAGLWLALRRGVSRYPTLSWPGEKYQGWTAEADLMARLDAWRDSLQRRHDRKKYYLGEVFFKNYFLAGKGSRGT